MRKRFMLVLAMVCTLAAPLFVGVAPAQAASAHRPSEIKCGWSPWSYTSCERRRDWYESVWGYVPGNNAHNLRKKAAAVYGDAIHVTPGLEENFDHWIDISVRSGRWQCVNKVIDDSAWVMQGKIAPVVHSMQAGSAAAKRIGKYAPSLRPYAKIVNASSKLTKGTVAGVGMLTISRAAVSDIKGCDPYA